MEKKKMVEALGALAQETRLDIFRLLVQAGPQGLAAGAIGDQLDIPAATLSFHLKELRNAGLVCCEKAGRSRIYCPDFVRVNELLTFLSANCCQGVGEEVRGDADCSAAAVGGQGGALQVGK